MERNRSQRKLVVVYSCTDLGFLLATYNRIGLFHADHRCEHVLGPCIPKRSLTGIMDRPVDVKLFIIAPTTFLIPVVLEIYSTDGLPFCRSFS